MIRTALACLVALSLAVVAHADQGNPKLKKIEAIRFGPNGLLIVGGGSDVVTIETGDTKPITWTKTDITGIDETLAGKLGLKAKDIEITRIAVNPASMKLYVLVRSLKAKENAHAILTIDGDGKIGEFSLEDVKYTKYPLAFKDGSIKLLTDVIWAGGRIVAATQASDTFESRVFTIFPGKNAASFVTETFHTGHKKIETKAPIKCLMTYEEDSKANIVGSFTCTPIVKYSLDDSQPGVQVKGTTVVELGTGNTPRSMFAYEKDGKKYILINAARNNKQPAPNIGLPNGYWCAKVDHTLLKETVNVNENAPWRVGGKGAKSLEDRVIVAKDYFGTHFMDKLDDGRAVIIRDADKQMSLKVLALP
jgi:hypothetical protein